MATSPMESHFASSSDPAAQFIFAWKETVPAADSAPAREVIKFRCLFCEKVYTWTSWVRVRGHLSGDPIMALSSGTTKCDEVTGPVAEKVRALPSSPSTPPPSSRLDLSQFNDTPTHATTHPVHHHQRGHGAQAPAGGDLSRRAIEWHCGRPRIDLVD